MSVENHSLARGLNGWCRSLVLRGMRNLRGGRLVLRDGAEQHEFGVWDQELGCTLRVRHPRFYRRLALGGGLGFAESLVAGEVDCDDLTSLVRIFIRSLELADRLDRGLARPRQCLAMLRQVWNRNTRRGAARNIRAHYDLGNELFGRMLDETWSYSCGVFEEPKATLREASLAKQERICRKLDLAPGDHLLEIGSGWGGLALHAAAWYGCRVTTATISPAQHAVAVRRVQQAGLAERVKVVLCDYRDLVGQYDKLVSIEMIEAIGYTQFETFFRNCTRLLAPQGMLLLQSIVIRDQRFQAHVRGLDFIREYIFPGGCLPSVAALFQASSTASDLRVAHLEDIGQHYVPTLRCWRERFRSRRDELRPLGYDDRFFRMWDYYLSYCEAAFLEQQVHDVQILYARPGCVINTVDLTRAIAVPTPQRRVPEVSA